MKIGITTEMFSDAIGATDFIRIVVKGLRLREKNKFYLLVSTAPFDLNRDQFSRITEKILPILRHFKGILRKLEKELKYHLISPNKNINIGKMKKYIDTILDKNKKNIKILTYSTAKELYEIIDKHKIRIILPINLPKRKYPSVSYLYDCQHKYYPQFFSKTNLIFRNYRFPKICKKSKAIIINSKDAKKDLMKFYNGKDETIFNLPFAPIIQDGTLKNQPKITKKDKFPKKYFIVSNQFWKHKSLETVFEALKILKDQNKNYFVIFTGLMDDYRFPNYINELMNYVNELGVKNRVKFLGLIPKRYQLEILKNAVAVIQPTLFEGGPGGGSVYDAVSLGVRAIVTDIPINHELPIKEGYLELFEKQNSEELAKKMENFWEKKYKRTSNKILLNNKKKYLKKFSDRLYEAIKKAMK